MRKKVQSFTISDEVMEMLRIYAVKQCWSVSHSVEKILNSFLQVEIGGKKSAIKKPSGPYIDSLSDVEAMKNFGKDWKVNDKKKTKNDIDFENSIRDTINESF